MKIGFVALAAPADAGEVRLASVRGEFFIPCAQRFV